MSALSKIANATASGGGTNIRDGRYKYLIEKCIYQKGHKGENFIVELRVIESASNGDVDERGQPTIPNAVGSTCSMACLLDKHASAAGNAKAFLIGALAPIGYSESQIDEPLLLEVSGPNNPLRGICIGNETRRGWNKGTVNKANEGKPMTLNVWRAIAQTPEDIQAQRTWLDSNLSRADKAPSVVRAADPVASTTVSAPAVVAPVVAAVTPVVPTSPGLLAALGISK